MYNRFDWCTYVNHIIKLEKVMIEHKVMVLGLKETFIIRVLVKKLNDAGIEAKFVPATVNDINNNWNKYSLLTYYLESGERIAGEVTRFLCDKLMDIENDRQLILIGDAEDARIATDNLPGEYLYKVFHRPLDNESYIQTVTEVFGKIKEGEFKKRILVVDDDATYLSLIREWLRDEYKVSMANSGLQAIKWLAGNKVDLILLDHEMPVTTGPQVLSMLRADEETKNIPVIFLTGKGDKESVMQVVALKPEGYFLKNVTRNELLEKLGEFFAKRG